MSIAEQIELLNAQKEASIEKTKEFQAQKEASVERVKELQAQKEASVERVKELQAQRGLALESQRRASVAQFQPLLLPSVNGDVVQAYVRKFNNAVKIVEPSLGMRIVNSSLVASPFAILSSILHIQPEPSLQGVHCPQLSCL